MSDYLGKGRSSFVKVTNKEKVILIAKLYGLEYEVKNERIAFFSTNDDGEPTTTIYDDNYHMLSLGIELGLIADKSALEVELPEFTNVISEYLCDDEVYVWKHTGGYMFDLNGYSIAVNNKKQSRYVNINDIHLVGKELGTIKHS